ncbi:HlyD family efflux transporter periplasmic adaptor subunit [Mucilaginibacter sp.]|uniref:HlyD family efflux transporter periplasmic adaptor subunit n=1 Tax=Mucilaginibacter sp. TaxID=1882438 RepID=UPI00284A3C83|nr:HlyD family efflux transporter periplasmic adaptor subunit [Mucilaginibacter sp.]MDR3696276.1 HlyD family efflux transporter periplasmic adaptor subunit [Mucilaginibacter sp.]
MKSIKSISDIKRISSALLLCVLLISACSQHKKTKDAAEEKNVTLYTCPMHHQIVEEHPGSCPICGMTLVKKTGQASELARISLNTVLKPVNSSVISTIEAITPEEKAMPTQIKGQGYLDFDSRTFNNIAARFSGRIEKLYIKSAFEEIHRGQRILDIYSPDMVTAQQDLIFLTKNSAQETGLINAARQKLLLLGMTEQQVDQVVRTGKAFYSLPVYNPYDGHVHDAAHSLMSGPSDPKATTGVTANLPLAIKEGMYVQQGQTLFNVANAHMLWALIKIDNASVSGLRLNQPVEITFPDIPGKTIEGKVDFIEPALQEGDKTTTIRVYVHNMDHALKVNSIINATIQTGQTKGLWVPRTALYNLGQTTIVWVKNGPVYSAHKVITGTSTSNGVEVKSGLSVTDSLASNAQYLTDSESFIKTEGNE